MDELATDDLSKDELVTDRLATDELATDALLELLASKTDFVPRDDVDSPKETICMTSSSGTTTIPWWQKACRETLTWSPSFSICSHGNCSSFSFGLMLSAF